MATLFIISLFGVPLLLVGLSIVEELLTPNNPKSGLNQSGEELIDYEHEETYR